MTISTDLDLAELAREQHAYAEAEGRYLRILGGAPPDGTRLTALSGLAWVKARTGRIPEALASYEEARALARRLDETEAEILLTLGEATAADWANDAPAGSRLAGVAQALSLTSGVSTRAIRAGLMAGRGRTQFRQCRWQQACADLETAVRLAAPLGNEGYEALIVALVLLEVVLPCVGRAQDAERVADRAVGLARARGDSLSLASAINNRRNLLVARKDLQGAISDQRVFRDIGRQLGLTLAEYYAEYNIAEMLYQSGDVDGAQPFLERARAFEELQPSVAQRPIAALLQARMLAYQGRVAEARRQLERVRAAVEQARAQDRPAGLLSPSENVMAEAVDLATRDTGDLEWETLLERSTQDSIEQEPIEIRELRAHSALRHGRHEAAHALFRAALELAARLPGFMEPRLRRAAQACETQAGSP